MDAQSIKEVNSEEAGGAMDGQTASRNNGVE